MRNVVAAILLLALSTLALVDQLVRVEGAQIKQAEEKKKKADDDAAAAKKAYDETLKKVEPVKQSSKLPAGVAPPRTDEQILLKAGLNIDSASLLEFFHERAKPVADTEQLLPIARKLGDPTKEVRAAATAQLIARGTSAVPAIRYVINDLDCPEAVESAKRCLEWLEGTQRCEVPVAAARLLASRKPAGAAKVMLAYLPFADEPSVLDGIKGALVMLATIDGHPEPDLLKALNDPLPLRRAIAVEVLGASGQKDALPEARKLLADPKFQVRLRAALALAERYDEEAIGVLIDLLADLSADQRKPAEETLQQLAGEWSPSPALTGDDEVARKIRRDSWAAWWKNTDGQALIAAFRKRTLFAEDIAIVKKLIDTLGDNVFANRERAAMQLVAMGGKVVHLLREASQNPDLERSQRIKQCLKQIAEMEDKNRLPSAAARLLAVRKPDGAAEALLAFLPFTEDEQMKVEIGKALKHVVASTGKPEPVLLAALNDKMGLRRAAAAEALTGSSENWPAIRKLLSDTDSSVRLRAAIALVLARDKETVPALIDLVAELPSGQAWEAEDILYRLAGDKSPPLMNGDGPVSRKKFQDDWKTWWKIERQNVDMAQLESIPTLRGLTLIAQYSQNGGFGRVVEVDRAGKVRWQVDNLAGPFDACLLPGNRLLVAEINANQVSERDLNGKIIWQANTGQQGVSPGSVQRLTNGNTFVGCLNGNTVIEFDRAGKLVFTLNTNLNLFTAKKLANGQIICLTRQMLCVRLDATGKELKRFSIGQITGSAGDVTTKGHVIVPQANNTIVEYDMDGKIVWQVNVNGNCTATRLSNGNTLVACQQTGNVSEFDRNGRVVWEYKLPPGYFPFRARQR